MTQRRTFPIDLCLSFNLPSVLLHYSSLLPFSLVLFCSRYDTKLKAGGVRDIGRQVGRERERERERYRSPFSLVILKRHLSRKIGPRNLFFICFFKKVFPSNRSEMDDWQIKIQPALKLCSNQVQVRMLALVVFVLQLQRCGFESRSSKTNGIYQARMQPNFYRFKTNIE